jgi:transcriptional regulator with XRE-family HTH domain
MDGPSLLAAYLKDAGLSYRSFAARVGASHSLVPKWLSGDGKPGLELALGIEKATSGAIPFKAWLRKRSAKPRRASASLANKRLRQSPHQRRPNALHGRTVPEPGRRS